MTEFEQQVENYILADRQWPRQHRIAHAKMMMDKSAAIRDRMAGTHDTVAMVNFWRAVLQRNED